MKREDLERWLDAYGAAWESRDADAALRLFTDDARYHETPFDPPAVGREGIRAYWAGATGSQRDIRFRHEVLSTAERRGVARWWAEFARIGSEARLALEGILMLEFDDEGRCRELREWWHMARREGSPEGLGEADTKPTHHPRTQS